MAEEELHKLDELFKMGFVGEDEYHRRRADLLAANPTLSSTSPSSVTDPAHTLDLTYEDETSDELKQLYEDFVAFSKPPLARQLYTYLICLHPAANIPVSNRDATYLAVPKACLPWLLYKQEVSDEEVS